MQMKDVKEKFEEQILEKAADGFLDIDFLYELSHKITNALSNMDLLEILKPDYDLGKIDPEDDLLPENVFEIIRLNINKYLDEEYVYELAKNYGFDFL